MTTPSDPEKSYLKRLNEKPMEDDVFYMYGSTSTHITEETEYVCQIRATLEKIQNQLFKDENNGKNGLERNSFHLLQNGCTKEDNSFSSRFQKIVDKLKERDLQLLDVHRENEVLQIKLEATREAGSGALRDATRRLYESYSKKSEQLRNTHSEEKQNLKASVAEYEERFKKSVEKLNEVAEKIQEKHGRILDLEKLMERMQTENAALVEKKNELLRQIGDASNKNGCVAIKTEVSTVQEQINHLQHLMMSQHQNLRALIQEREELKNHLQEQDVTIRELMEKVNKLECQNKELKFKVENWSCPKTVKASKGTCVNEFMISALTPYLTLMKSKNISGNS